MVNYSVAVDYISTYSENPMLTKIPGEPTYNTLRQMKLILRAMQIMFQLIQVEDPMGIQGYYLHQPIMPPFMSPNILDLYIQIIYIFQRRLHNTSQQGLERSINNRFKNSVKQLTFKRIRSSKLFMLLILSIQIH